MNTLDYFIFKENALDEEICEKIISTSTVCDDWKKHTWYNSGKYEIIDKKFDENYDEFDVFYLDEKEQENIYKKLYPILIYLCKKYCKKYSYDETVFVNRIFPIRVNKYEEGTEMKKHYDHIHSLFSPPITGVPVLTILGILNDNYEGGEFILLDDKKIETKQGDIIIFPSNFMYPHSVNKINKGTRYSFVTWAA